MSKHSFSKLHRPNNTMPLKVKPVLLWLLLISLLAAGCSSNKSYRADRFYVDLALQPENVLLVTETVQFRFQGGPFTYAYRDLERNELDAIDQIEADMDGAPLPRGNGAGQVEIEDGDSLRITWHFAPVYDSTHIFTLRYRVLGAMRQEDGADVLRWYAIPPEHGYPITEATFRLRPPAGVTPLAAPRVLDGGQLRDTGDGLLGITGKDIGDDEEVIVEARFPAGSLLSTAPAWQVKEDRRNQQLKQAAPAGVAMFLLTLLLAGSATVWQVLRLRPPRPARDLNLDQTAPPSAAPPAMALALARRGTPPLATIFDLAQRGVLGIEEVGKRWGSRQFVLRRKEVPSTLRPHEHGLLEALFTGKKGSTDAIPLNQAATRLGRAHKAFDLPLDSEMELAGLLDPSRKAGLKRWAVLAGGMTALGMAAAMAGVIWGVLQLEHEHGSGVPAAIALVGAGLALLAVGWIALMAFMSLSPLTQTGMTEGDQWQRFGKYLEKVAKGKTPLSDTALFDRYLPHAAGFGLGEQWAKRYQLTTGFEVPPWFQSLVGDDRSAAFVAVMVSSHSSFNSSGGSGGGGGASGGGGSGAG